MTERIRKWLWTFINKGHTDQVERNIAAERGKLECLMRNAMILVDTRSEILSRLDMIQEGIEQFAGMLGYDVVVESSGSNDVIRFVPDSAVTLSQQENLDKIKSTVQEKRLAMLFERVAKVVIMESMRGARKG